MPITISGTTGIAGVDGSASTPAAQGSDTNTGVFYGTDTVSISTGGTARVVVNSDGQTVLGAGTASLPAMSTTGDLNTGTFYPAADTIGWTTGGSERARIDSSGNLLVGTTSLTSRLSVQQSTSSAYAADFYQSAASNQSTAAVVIEKADNTTTTSQVFVQFTINSRATGSGQINANGANTAAFGTYSDERLKENIVDLPSQLSNILSLRPREFDYIESEGGGHQIGFVAQEMQEVYPDAVGERSDGMLTVTAWSKTEARLVKAIQELNAKLEAAEARIAALEAK